MRAAIGAAAAAVVLGGCQLLPAAPPQPPRPHSPEWCEAHIEDRTCWPLGYPVTRYNCHRFESPEACDLYFPEWG